MPNKQRGIAELVIQGETYNLQLNLDALAEVEDALQLETLLEIQQALNPPKAKSIKVILAAMIMGGEDITMTEAMAIAGKVNLATIMSLPDSLSTIVELAMDAGDENPPAEAAPKTKTRGKRSR